MTLVLKLLLSLSFLSEREIKMIIINLKYYKKLACCWKRTDTIFVKRQKIYTEIENIYSENSELSKQEVVESLIADYKGQISNNNFMQFVSLIFSVLLAMIGTFLGGWYLIFTFLALIIIALSITLYCLRYLYAEGFVLHILENYCEENQKDHLNENYDTKI